MAKIRRIHLINPRADTFATRPLFFGKELYPPVAGLLAVAALIPEDEYEIILTDENIELIDFDLNVDMVGIQTMTSYVTGVTRSPMPFILIPVATGSIGGERPLIRDQINAHDKIRNPENQRGKIVNQRKSTYLITTTASSWTIFIRLSLAGVFIPEGIQKLIYPVLHGTGRFIKMGIPYPEFTGPLLGWVEIICGSLILFGYLPA